MNKIFIILFLTIQITRLFAQSSDLYDSIPNKNHTFSEYDQGYEDKFIDRSFISHLPVRTIKSLSLLSPSAYYLEENTLFFHGAEAGGDYVVVDGMRIADNSSFPFLGIEKFGLFMNEAPIQFGNSTAGFLFIQTPEISDSLTINCEFISPPSLKNYDNGLIELDIGGPVRLFRKSSEKNPDFYIAARLADIKDPDQSYIRTPVAYPDVLERLRNSPCTQIPDGFGVISNALFITEDSLTSVRYKENAGQKYLNTYSKIIIPVNTNINITLGTYANFKNGRKFIYENALLNSENQPEYIARNFDNYLRFTGLISETENIKFSWNVQLCYSNYYNVLQHPEHKDDFFNYGHVGKFNTYKINSYEFTDTLQGFPDGVYMHTSADYDTLITFEPSSYNPDLGRYTQSYYETYPPYSEYYTNATTIEQFGALLNGQNPWSIYGLWNIPGTVYDRYSKNQVERYSIDIQVNIDLTSHHIKYGLQYFKNKERRYDLRPVELWTLARQLTNVHILELDRDHPLYTYITLPSGETVFTDTIYYERYYSETIQKTFDRNFRIQNGIPVNSTEWIDIDSYDPSVLSIDMFSPDELLNNGNNFVNYYGYDYKGTKTKSGIPYMDFFNSVDEHGDYTRPVKAFEPVYLSGFFQDRFNFKLLNIEAGLRLDYYNANQLILKDPYVFRETYKAGDPQAIELSGGSRPDNIGDDFVVYVNNRNNPTAILGYRDGETWYDAGGYPIDYPIEISTVTGICPYLVDPHAPLDKRAFKDYRPVFNLLPQVNLNFTFLNLLIFIMENYPAVF
ncbi:MAG: hypothetical protein HY738_02080 [Bacteroidia bacterium]|nr:hypothetical protein [Bacteroidia bacterium]